MKIYVFVEKSTRKPLSISGVLLQRPGRFGQFTDMDGIPLAFCVNPGNTAETTTLKPLEDKLHEKFRISKVVVCTDGGLASYENRLNDPKRFIKSESCTIDGELAQYGSYTLNQEMIDQESRFAGFRTDTQIVSKQRMKKSSTKRKI